MEKEIKNAIDNSRTQRVNTIFNSFVQKPDVEKTESVEKAHVKSHTRTTKSGKVVNVKDYDDSRVHSNMREIHDHLIDNGYKLKDRKAGNVDKGGYGSLGEYKYEKEEDGKKHEVEVGHMAHKNNFARLTENYFKVRHKVYSEEGKVEHDSERKMRDYMLRNSNMRGTSPYVTKLVDLSEKKYNRTKEKTANGNDASYFAKNDFEKTKDGWKKSFGVDNEFTIDCNKTDGKCVIDIMGKKFETDSEEKMKKVHDYLKENKLASDDAAGATSLGKIKKEVKKIIEE